MIVDISATTWNWDTYAIVGGKPSPVVVTFEDEDELRQHLLRRGTMARPLAKGYCCRRLQGKWCGCPRVPC